MQLLSSLLILALIQACFAVTDVPVFMIDSEKIMSHWNIQPNPFDKISPFLFADIVHDAIKRSQCIIIFVEEHLCTEYVGVKDDFGSPYQNLRQGVIGKRVRYIPAATEPYETISNILIPHQENVLYLHSGVKLQADNSLKYLYIFFQDYYNATQVQSLRNHDSIMNDVYNTISKSKKKSGPIVAFYTGKVSPIPVEEVEFDPVKPDDVPSDMGVLVRAEGAMFRLSGVHAATSTRRAFFYQVPMVAEETWTDQTISTTISYTDFELLFNFRVEYNEWLLDHVALLEGGEEVGRTNMGVGAPWDRSYVCADPLSIHNRRDDSTVTISEYQIQPIHPRSQTGVMLVNAACFGPAISCGRYFSIQLISGLLVALLMTATLLLGVVMLMNCGTNDRFDDPHGKDVFVPADQSNT